MKHPATVLFVVLHACFVNHSPFEVGRSLFLAFIYVIALTAVEDCYIVSLRSEI
jgi:hypothetical protein